MELRNTERAWILFKLCVDFWIVSGFTVLSFVTFPVLTVVFGSSSINWVSSSANGLCSTPFGITTSSPSFNSIAFWSLSAWRVFHLSQGTARLRFPWWCQTKSPFTLTIFTFESLNSEIIFGVHRSLNKLNSWFRLVFFIKLGHLEISKDQERGLNVCLLFPEESRTFEKKNHFLETLN